MQTEVILLLESGGDGVIDRVNLRKLRIFYSTTLEL